MTRNNATSSYDCPHCGQSLSQTAHGQQWHCAHCEQDYLERVLCPTCQSPLEVLKACGAVDYFCPQCNSLQSKRQVIYQLQSI
ncbi:zinc ribbon domain-containing protein [Celerinatantimonas yamalensis]|uniref:Zinc ribbon domain-containing protein n=1 Tax=Celerinatantimonas yamalensis TaxID=559956 RepID=A0ABW9GAP5_9GAMM